MRNLCNQRPLNQELEGEVLHSAEAVESGVECFGVDFETKSVSLGTGVLDYLENIRYLNLLLTHASHAFSDRFSRQLIWLRIFIEFGLRSTVLVYNTTVKKKTLSQQM